MTAYRNDYDAAILLNGHLERDVKDLLKENDELKVRVACSAAIAKELLNTEPCVILVRRIEELETENILLSMEKAMLEHEPQAELLEQLANLENQRTNIETELHRTRYSLRSVSLAISLGLGAMGMMRLFW